MVKTEIMTIMGAPLEGTNPLPIFHDHESTKFQLSEGIAEEYTKDLGCRKRVLPYKIQDRYSRKRLPLKMKTIVMENAYLKAVIWPESGARLYSLFDKVNGRHLLMANPVYQPGNLAIRNAWLSGGIEWNFGNIGHHVNTCENMFAAVLQDEDGNDFVRVYEFERCKGAVYQIDFHLPEESPVLYAHIKLFNPSEKDTTTYWWTNIAVPEDGHTRVLSSVDMVIGADDTGLSYEKLPNLSVLGDVDATYPLNFPRSFDYFFQAPDDATSTWEASAGGDGFVFFTRSTAPLNYHKMFCWGNHAAANHWQEFLSDPEKGYYIELQGGIARSQLHDKLFPANSTIEWTEVFGGGMFDSGQLHQKDWAAANAYLDTCIDSITCEEDLQNQHKKFSRLAEIELSEEKLIHLGSGWGALENLRRQIQGEKPLPKSMCFPKFTLGEEQYQWYALLTEGKLPEESPDVIPASWMTEPKWLELLEESIRRHGENWYNQLHLGVMLREQMDHEHLAKDTDNWPLYPEYTERAKQAFLRSLEYKPSVWALRCLFCLERDAGNDVQAERYYDQVFEQEACTMDFAFAAEYMRYLNGKKNYEKVWQLYNSLPKDIQQVDRMMLCVAQAAVKLRKLDFVATVFEREYADIQEGENSLTNIWFEYCARKMAKERGMGEDIPLDLLNALMEEAWDACPPPPAIDFRMSLDKNNAYRMEEK